MSDHQIPVPLPVDRLIEFRLTQAEKHIAKQDEQIHQLEHEIRENRSYYQNCIQEMKDNHEAERRSQLKWGISSLGTLVTILIGIVWNYRTSIFKIGGGN